MKIAVLTNSFPPAGRGGALHRPVQGGAARIASMQVEMMRDAGHEVRVWAPSVNWFDVPSVVRLFFHLRDLSARQDIVREMCDWKPDALITHNLTGCGFGTVPRLVGLAQDRRPHWIHMLHDVQLFEPSGQVTDARPITLWQKMWSVLRQRALRHPNLVISPTQWLLDEHRRRGFFLMGKSVVLPNPCPFSVGATAGGQTHRSAPTQKNPLGLLFVGRPSADKGSEMLTEIERITGQPIDRAVDLDHAAVLEKMREADVLLVPSQIEENQPTVILEAASVGLPVIASDKGGIRETVGDAGQVVNAYDVKAWCAAIRSITINEDAYQKASKQMFVLAERHDPSRYRETFLFLLKSNV